MEALTLLHDDLGHKPCPVFRPLPALRSPEPPGQLQAAGLRLCFTRSAMLAPHRSMLSGTDGSAVC